MDFRFGIPSRPWPTWELSYAPISGKPEIGENASNVMTLPAVLLAFLADALDRDHALAFGGVEHDHALGRAPGDADAFDAGADQLAAVGDQHELVAVLDRERGDQLAGLLADRAAALPHVPRHDAFPAA